MFKAGNLVKLDFGKGYCFDGDIVIVIREDDEAADFMVVFSITSDRYLYRIKQSEMRQL